MRFVICNKCVGRGVVKQFAKELICDMCGGAGKINKERGVNVEQQLASSETINDAFQNSIVIDPNSMPSLSTQTQRQYSAKANTSFNSTFSDRFVPQARTMTEYERAQSQYMKSISELSNATSEGQNGRTASQGGYGIADLTPEAQVKGSIVRQTEESRLSTINYNHLMNNVERENLAAQLTLRK